jgi:ribose transport system substrate-binding protein
MSRKAWVILVALVLFGVGPSALAQKKWTIGYDIYFVGNTWSVQLAEEFKAAAARNSDQIANVVYTESEGRVDKQISNIEDMIAKGVDAIIITPNSPSALAPVVEEAMNAGIKVILCAAKVDTGDYTSLVTVDDTEFGKVGAQWLVEQLGGNGKIIMINGIPGISVNEERIEGAMSVFNQYPGIQVVGQAAADWDYAKAKTAVSNLLAANPQIDGVWSQGGAMTLGAIEAFQAANRPLVPMTGEDNNGFMKKWAELAPQGFDSIAVAKPTWLSAQALDIALDALNGKAVTKDNILPPPVITNDNLGEFVRPDLSDSLWAQTRLTDEQLQQLFNR